MRTNISTWEVEDAARALEDNKDEHVVKIVERAKSLVRQYDQVAQEKREADGLLKAYRLVMQDCMRAHQERE